MSLTKLLTRLGGYDRLAASYPAHGEPAGERFDRDTVQFGSVRWKWCTTVIVSGAGLYVQARPPVIGTLPPVLIPWHEITHVEPTRLYWQRTALLTVGEPAVVKLKVLPRVLTAMQRHLPAGEH